eukprot:jgi/Tetstr1/436223/TSEL_025068.t1
MAAAAAPALQQEGPCLFCLFEQFNDEYGSQPTRWVNHSCSNCLARPSGSVSGPRREDAVDFKDHLEKLLDDVRRTVQGSHSYAPILAGWGAVLPGWSPSGGAGGLLAYKAASLRNGDKPRLHRGGGGGGGDGETSRDNFFVYKMLKQVPDADPPPYTTEDLESEEELPRNLLAEREDAKYTTMVARAQHFYLATPPPPPRADSDDSRAIARPIRAALCTVWTPERAHTAVGLDLWRVPGGGGGSGGEEALVLLDGPGIRKVAVLMAPADMSSTKAADFGVDAGELLVAGIHARSHDGAWGGGAAAVG